MIGNSQGYSQTFLRVKEATAACRFMTFSFWIENESIIQFSESCKAKQGKYWPLIYPQTQKSEFMFDSCGTLYPGLKT